MASDSVSASESRRQLAQLAELERHGTEVVIARRGTDAARLDRPGAARDRDMARATAQRIRDMSTDVTLGGISLKALIGEGRR